jgi:hypothetical protein
VVRLGRPGSLLACPVVLVAVLASVAVSPASAAPQPALVVWAGPLVPGTALHGVRLKANGTGTLLLVKRNHRASGKVTTAGSFAPTAEQLGAIRAAAKAAFAKPGVKTASDQSTGSHGGYASAVIGVGGKTRTLLGVNTSSAPLRALLVVLNEALPAAARLEDPETGLAQLSSGPSTAACPPGQGPTTISRRLPLDKAAQLGIVTLTAKGGFNGDAVAVDAKWTPADAPVTVQIDIEFSSYPGGPSAAQVEASIESRLPPRTAIDGTQVKFDIVASERAAGAPPSPCFHQVQLLHNSNYRGDAGEADQNPLTTPQAGEWPSGRGAVGDRQIWTHEALHFAGLGDRYGSFFKVGKKLYPIPDDVDLEDKKALEEWAKSQGLDVNAGKAGTKALPGFEQDIMGDVFKGTEKLAQIDVDTFALTGADELTIEGKPGDLLLNKEATAQNLMVGAPFELTVKPGKDGHADGLVAYCIDLGRHSPSEGQGYDVLGSAGAQPQESMHYLQRLAEVAAALQTVPLETPEGAQDAIWRITDESAPFESGRAVLALAGIPDVVFDAPHFADPNAGSPATRAVSVTGVLPRPAPAPYVKSVRVRPAKLAAGRARAVKATIVLGGARDKLRIELQRRKHRQWHRLKRLGARKLRPGSAKLRLHLPPLRRGAFRLVVIGEASSATAALRVR